MPWPPSKIERVGIELEGGWDTPPAHPMHIDGSVQVRANYVGEISSKIMKPKQALKWMSREDIYPDHVDQSCGLHVHVSFRRNNDCAAIGAEAFNDAFLQHMSDWGAKMHLPADHPFWPRLRGEHVYCTKRWLFIDQLRGMKRVDPDCRRTQINACAYPDHGTIECRMLPMFHDMGVGVRAIKDYVTFVDDWLTANAAALDVPVTIDYIPTPATNITIEHTIKCA